MSFPLRLWLQLPLVAVLGSGCAATNERQYLLLENDLFAFANPSDNNYTSGFRLGRLQELNEDSAAGTQTLASATTGIGAWIWGRSLDDFHHLVDFSLNQRLYTPEDKTAAVSDPNDRPFAGHLDLRFATHSHWVNPETSGDGDRLITTEVGVGMVGPASLGSETQNFVHDLGGLVDTRDGWENQLSAELTLQMTTSRRERHFRWGAQGWGMDGSSLLGIGLGTAQVYGTGGVEVRLGYNLGRDFGPASFDQTPSLSFFPVPEELERRVSPHSVSLSLGADVRGVAHNLFLDGGTFNQGPSVNREEFFADYRWALEYRYKRYFVRYTQVLRTREFEEFEPDYHRFGSIQFGLNSSF